MPDDMRVPRKEAASTSGVIAVAAVTVGPWLVPGVALGMIGDMYENWPLYVVAVATLAAVAGVGAWAGWKSAHLAGAGWVLASVAFGVALLLRGDVFAELASVALVAFAGPAAGGTYLLHRFGASANARPAAFALRVAILTIAVSPLAVLLMTLLSVALGGEGP
jgi:hypothetical protein